MTGRPRILLVDSNTDDRALAALLLRRELSDLEVEEVGDGMALADRLPLPGLAAVVTEYRLDWGDGLQVLETVRAVAPHCPVVFFASAGSEAVAARGLRQGLVAARVARANAVHLREAVGERQQEGSDGGGEPRAAGARGGEHAGIRLRLVGWCQAPRRGHGQARARRRPA